MKKIVIILLVLSFAGSCCNISYAAQQKKSSGVKTSNSKTTPSTPPAGKKSDKKAPPPPPPVETQPVTVINKDITVKETNFSNCLEHFLIQETATTYYSDGTSKSDSIYSVTDYNGIPIASNCLSIKHFIYNNVHYLLLREAVSKYKIINAADGESNFDIIYSDLSVISDNRLLAKLDGKYGIINFDNEEILPITYQSIKKLNVRLYRIKQNGCFGIVKADGTVVLPANNDKISALGEYYRFKKNDKFGVVDRYGNIIAPAIYKKVKIDKNRLTGTRDGESWTIILN